MASNVSPIRQRQNHVFDARFITNVVLSVYSLHISLCLFLYICIYIYIWTIYILNIWIYLLNISTCAGGLSHRWFERESLIIQIRPYRLYVTNYKVYYIRSTVSHCHIGERKSQRRLITNMRGIIDVSEKCRLRYLHPSIYVSMTLLTPSPYVSIPTLTCCQLDPTEQVNVKF